MKRVSDPDELRALLEANCPPELIGNGDLTNGPARWLSNPANIALRQDNDLTMFEHMGDGLYEAHVYFASRGKQAIQRGKAMLHEVARLGAKTIYGVTPLSLPNALLFARLVGFRPVREVERKQGRCMFSLWEQSRPKKPAIEHTQSLA